MKEPVELLIRAWLVNGSWILKWVYIWREKDEENNFFAFFFCEWITECCCLDSINGEVLLPSTLPSSIIVLWFFYWIWMYSMWKFAQRPNYWNCVLRLHLLSDNLMVIFHRVHLENPQWSIYYFRLYIWILSRCIIMNLYINGQR